MTQLPKTYRRLLSTVREDGTLTLAFHDTPMPTPKPDQIVIRVEAAPINPSDHGVMFGAADVSAAKTHDGGLVAPVGAAGMARMRGRIGQDLPIGNEGAGKVVAAGSSDAAQALMGQTVAAMGGTMYAEYAVVPLSAVLPLGESHTARDGASSFVNPLTALCMVETMRGEGHTALVHTAAASNLGQMLVRICADDDVPLVCIVRRAAQVKQLKDLGAKHVVNSSDDDFLAHLTDAVHATGATLAFDATGGGTLASDILTAMEMAAARTPGAYSIYGSVAHKQVYLYGSLDFSPTMLTRAYGMAWGVGGWLLPNFLAKAGVETAMRLRQRVRDELTTTFASTYSHEISLDDMVDPKIARATNARRTGEKYLVCPHKS